MAAALANDIISRYPLVSDQITTTELKIILQECENALNRTDRGDVVELGCYIGTTSLFLSRLLSRMTPTRQLYVYDSFAGLPLKSARDMSPLGEQFKAGELHASKKEFIARYRQAGLRTPIIKKAWFSEITTNDMPRMVAFAFLDGDYYESIVDSLKLVWPNLIRGASIVVDDYTNDALPGARKAVDGWLRDHPARLQIKDSLAVITPPGGAV